LGTISASCIPKGRALVLHINYLIEDSTFIWEDTFSFEGETVRKKGRFLQTKKEQADAEMFYSVDWAEELHKTK